MSTNLKIRKTMVEEIIKEVRGPRNGVNEVLDYDPWDEYLTGIIVPKDWESNVEERDVYNYEDSSIVAEQFNSEDELNEIDYNYRSGQFEFIKSFGVSFAVENPNPTLNICATWARYLPDEDSVSAFNLQNEEHDIVNKNRKIPRAYKRFPFGEIVEIEVNNKKVDDNTIIKDTPNSNELLIVKTLNNYYTEDDFKIKLQNKNVDRAVSEGSVKIYIKRLKKENQYIFSVFMVNELNTKNRFAPTFECLFQPSLRINCNKQIKIQKIESVNENEKEFDFLYRKNPTVSSGIMCSSVWKDIDYVDQINIEQLWPDYQFLLEKDSKFNEFLVPDVRSEFIPLYPITLPNFDLVGNDNFGVDDFKADNLANKSPQEIYDLLINLTKLYKNWINSNIQELKNINEKNYSKIAKKIVNDEKEALKRMENGIKLIKNNDLVYTAFCFANKVIDLQNSWRNSDFEFKWRPFQIAFILMNIEDIWDENSKNRDVLDLLWIPTGGGKTEAYLGIMAYTMALRRLKGSQNGEYAEGTSIISRYTLRLLTVQQFRRTLKMVTAAEYLRVYDSEGSVGWRPKHSKIQDNWIYGSVRFSIGLWVGGGVSPIHLLKEGTGAISLLKGEEVKVPYELGEPAQILKCPICGSWLSVPKNGLNDKVNNLHIVVKFNDSIYVIEDELKELFIQSENIELTNIESKKHKDNIYTLSFVIYDKFSRKEFLDKIYEPLEKYGLETQYLGEYNIGYFSSLSKIQRIRGVFDEVSDFEIWCTNPKCNLNNVEWKEGCAYGDEDAKPDFPDGNFEREIETLFTDNSRMPIPAYVIDDHVYNRCPTVVISTVDKIARLAFEPRAASIFGNINYYNRYYGYNRNAMFPKNHQNTKRFNVPIKQLKAPDLIIQDELHLIDGPLGSLYGLYEAMVSGIIKKQGGNPKYIASTATISNAINQVDLLFSKDLSQFPPHGLDISNSFFVRNENNDIWDEDNAGRLYMGIYTPGKPYNLLQTRLWSKALKTAYDNKDNDFINNYWTIVGYYNTIADLGNSISLYRDNVKTRLHTLCGNNNECRSLYDEDMVELSGRMSSTFLPLTLDELERDGLNEIPNYDSIFATSMFGTGVDISHLSMMIMAGQPKVIGSYIQSTGRIGRKRGGLIIDLLKAGRSRDLNHYEMFNSFHSKMYLWVEPVSVSPFSKGCLSRGLGPSFVAFLRNAMDLSVNWENNDDASSPIKDERSEDDFEYIYNYIKERLYNMKTLDDGMVCAVLEYLKEAKDDWRNVANNLQNGKALKMYENVFYKPKQNVVLGTVAHEYHDNLKVVYNNAPYSLRDVEDEIDFWV